MSWCPSYPQSRRERHSGFDRFTFSSVQPAVRVPNRDFVKYFGTLLPRATEYDDKSIPGVTHDGGTPHCNHFRVQTKA